MVVTVQGMVMEAKDVQQMKALLSMVFSCEPSAKATEARDSQLLKTISPIVVTVEGMVMEAKDVQEAKAEVSMVSSCEPSAKVTEARDLQL